VPIRLRLTAIFTLGVAVLVALGAVLFVHQLRRGLNASIDSGLRSRAGAIANAVADQPGRVELADSGGPLAPTEPLAQVLRPDGTIVDSSGVAGGQPLLDAAQLGAARRHSVLLTTTLPLPTGRARLLAAPAPRGAEAWVTVVGTPLEASEDAVERVKDSLVLAGVAVVVLTAVAAWLLAGAALAPMERLRRQVAAVSEHDLDTRIEPTRSNDEVAALGRTMNDLLGRLQRALARERTFVADAGHELRTPLAILRTELELARRPGRTRDELAAAVTEAGEETDRLARLAEDLLTLARADQSAVPLRPTHLGDLLSDAVTAARPRARGQSTDLRLEAGEPVVATADAGSVRRAVDNLIDNALRFAPPGTAVAVSLRREAQSAVIEVSDRGEGFPDAFLPHAFERFGRPDDSRSRGKGGTGLGLAIVASIAASHGGRAEAANRTGGGAVVRVRLPLDH